MAAHGTKRPRRKQHTLLKARSRSEEVLLLPHSVGQRCYRAAQIQGEGKWAPSLPGTSEDLLPSLYHPKRQVNPQVFHKPGPGQTTPLELPMANMPFTSILARGMGGACLHKGGSDRSSVTGPDIPRVLWLENLESVDTEDDNKGMGPDKGHEKYSNTNCRIPVTLLQKSSNHTQVKEAEQMWPDEIHYSIQHRNPLFHPTQINQYPFLADMKIHISTLYLLAYSVMRLLSQVMMRYNGKL